MSGPSSLLAEDHVSLCEVLDRVLNKGVVVAGEIIISVADIDLVYLGLRLVLTSVETACRFSSGPAAFHNPTPAGEHCEPAGF